VDAGDGVTGRCMVGLSVAAIDYEFRRAGQLLFVDTDDKLKVWGLKSRRSGLPELLSGHEEQMKRFLIARALRGSV
jgi:predicted ABC-type transport system involved in lysophospholipase L1 biosynthesis ATPase subunit